MAKYITTPIYYVNGKPHIGHLYTTVIADVLARYFRMFQEDVFFATGTDEHGIKVQQAAGEREIYDFVDERSQAFRDMMKKYNLEYTDFIRTTEDRHKRTAEYMWRVLEEKGYIYKGIYEGWYAIREECYYDASEVENGFVKGTNVEVQWMQEECYYFRLSQFQPALVKFFDTNRNFIQPKIRSNEIREFLKSPLKDLCISRSNFSWGIPVPKDRDHVMYVWIDALVNYISILGYGSELYDKFWPPYVHIMGKDIIKFHAIYWVAILMALEIELPQHLLIHGWWLAGGEKMSKSLGNVIDINELLEVYTVDEIRYFMMREMTFASDGNFDFAQVNMRINGELNNKFGNLIQRLNIFVEKFLDGEVPLIDKHDSEILNYVRFQGMAIKELVENFQLKENLEFILELIDKCNEYIDEKKPWILVKTDKEAAQEVIAELINAVKYIVFFLEPYMPSKMQYIIKAWNLSFDYEVSGKIAKLDILFSKK